MLVPKLRFKREDGTDYPEWEKHRIGDLFYKVNERNNGQFDKTKWISVARMYYQVPDKVTSNNIDTRTYVMRLGDMAFEGHPNSDFLFGRFVVNDIGDGVISELFPIYRHKTEYILKYWKYAIQIEQVMAHIYRKSITSSGASSNKLNDDDFLRESICVPCLEEQRKIADFLSNVDEVIAQSEAEVQNLEQQKKAAVQKIFSQEVRFKREDGTDYPDWEEKKMSELFNISAGGDVDKSNSSSEQSDDYPYAIYANALTNNGLYGYANYYKVEQDCFTVTGRGDIGYAVSRHEKFVPVVRLLVCVPKHNENVDCFAEIVNNTSILVESTGVPQLTSIQLGKIRIIYPTHLEEQQKIADFLSAFDETITYAKQELEKWKELKKGLLQQMFV